MSGPQAVRAVLLTAGWAAASGFAPAADETQTAAATQWAVRVPIEDKATYRGSVDHDQAGLKAGPMFYAVPGVAGFLAAAATHGALNAGLKASQKRSMQASADEVLQPFEPVLSGLTNRRLLELSVPRVVAPSPIRVLAATEAGGAAWVIATKPVFSMTMDRRALILDNSVQIFGPGASTASYARAIRIVSAPLSALTSVPAPVSPPASNAMAEPAPVVQDAMVPVWLAEGGRLLSDQSAALLAESFELAVSDFTLPAFDDKTPHETFRYAEGGIERMERAQLVKERCGRTLIRTLRGDLMSIPAAAQEPNAGCSLNASIAAEAPSTSPAR